ncbi:MAG: FKBP-type peptidyl-prolyl cis-trans isomerase [bacterium]
MKYLFSVILAVFLISTVACQSKIEKKDLKTNKDTVSYAIGYDIGRNFKTQSLEIEIEKLSKGISDGLADSAGTNGLFTQDEIKQIFTTLQQQMMAKQQAKMDEAGKKNKDVEAKFLAENSKKPGVITTASGLQYKVIKSGSGPSPKATEQVTVHYRGTLINGNEFDSSLKTGQPVTFPVTGVITGWTEALQLMKVGDKWELYIPSALAYGERGAGQMIEPGATLIFEVELLGIAPAEKK